MKTKLFLTIFLTISITTVFSVPSNVKKPVDVGIEEHLDSYIPNDIVFTNDSLQQVNLKSLINYDEII